MRDTAKIENLRSKMNKAYKDGISLTEPTMLNLSKKLDHYLTQYYKKSVGNLPYQ